MEKVVEAIVLRAVEFKDNDKIVTLLTREEGKLTVKMRGVKNAKAKLKHASIPFFHGRYYFTKTKTGFVLTGVDSISHYDYSAMSLSSYYIATLILEIADKLSVEGFEDCELFDKAIREIANIDKDKNVLLSSLTILRDFLVVSGHGLNELYPENANGFSYDEGGLCDVSKSAGMKLTPSMVEGVKKLLQNKPISESLLPNLLTLISSYFAVKIGKKLNTVEQIVKMFDIFD